MPAHGKSVPAPAPAAGRCCRSVLLSCLVFLAGPVLWAFHASFTNAALTGRNARSPGWVGLENYQRLFTDPLLPLSLALTSSLSVARPSWARTCWDSPSPC